MIHEETDTSSSLWSLQQSFQVGVLSISYKREKQSSKGLKIPIEKAHEDQSSKARHPELHHHILCPMLTFHHLWLTMTVTSLPLLAAYPLHTLFQEWWQWVYEVDTHGTKWESEIQWELINKRQIEHKEHNWFPPHLQRPKPRYSNKRWGGESWWLKWKWCALHDKVLFSLQCCPGHTNSQEGSSKQGGPERSQQN